MSVAIFLKVFEDDEGNIFYVNSETTQAYSDVTGKYFIGYFCIKQMEVIDIQPSYKSKQALKRYCANPAPVLPEIGQAGGTVLDDVLNPLGHYPVGKFNIDKNAKYEIVSDVIFLKRVAEIDNGERVPTMYSWKKGTKHPPLTPFTYEVVEFLRQLLPMTIGKAYELWPGKRDHLEQCHRELRKQEILVPV